MIENLWTHGDHAIEVWKAAALPDLITHIVEHYHLEARVEMARMENLAEEVVLLGDGEPSGQMAVRDEIARFCKEFRAHMTMEERSLFPYFLDPGGSRAAGHAVLMPPLVKLLEDEHLAETGLFRRLRSLTADAIPPAGARNLRTRLERSFKAMEKSLQGHLFLETQVLFRRVL